MFISKRSNGIYHIYYYKSDGNLTSISAKTKIKAEATLFLKAFSKDLQAQDTQQTPPLTLLKFIDEYLIHSKAMHTYWTTYSYKQTFGFFKKFFGNVDIGDLTHKDITRYIEDRIITGSIYQARKDLINISAAFNWAIPQGYLEESPCKYIKKIKVPQKLPHFYTEEDFTTLLNVIDSQDIKDLVVFAVNTGMRQMELITLRWNQVNLKSKIVILDNQTHITKGKKVRMIPLNSKAVGALTNRNKKSELVFTYKGKPMAQDFITHKFSEYVVKSGLNTKLNFHSLRHSFASWLVQAGVSIYEVSKLLGHSDIKTTQIYAHLRTDDLRRSVDLLEY